MPTMGRMKNDPVAEITERAEAVGSTVREVLKKAKVNPSVFHRWKHQETTPTFRTYKRIIAVLERMERKAA